MIFFRQRVRAIPFTTVPEISWPNNTGPFQCLRLCTSNLPLRECHEAAWRIHAVSQHMVRKRAKVLHPDDRAGVACRDALVLEMVQILHRSVVDNLACHDNHEVSFRGWRNDDLAERLVEFHQIHAADRRQVNFIRVLHLSDGSPYCTGRNGHDTVPLTRATAVSDSDDRIAE